MIVISNTTDGHVTAGNSYVVAYTVDTDHVIVWDDEGGLWDLLKAEFTVEDQHTDKEFERWAAGIIDNKSS